MSDPTESELLPRKRCEELMLAVEAAAYRHGVQHVEILASASEEALTRFANNTIHQNVSERGVVLSIRTVIGDRTARASTNQLHRDGISAAVDEAVSLTKASGPVPDLPALYESTGTADGSRWSQAAASCTPAERAAGVAEAIRVVEGEGQTAAGMYSTSESVEVLMNSRGLSRYYFETLTTFAITAMSGDSSGWAKASSAEHSEINPAELAARAVGKAKLSAKPIELAPGAYTVILEPAAVLDLVGQIFGDFSATAMEDQRSFLNDRLGERLFGDNITVYDDCHFPLQIGAPFDGEGVPRHALTLIKCGVAEQIAFSREAAAKAGKLPTGHGYPLPNEIGEAPINIVIAGGGASLEEIIAKTENGILVTRFWYIREVEPYNKVMTGMTRDGTFLIRNGEIAQGLRNFRFNQSVIDLLNNVETLTASGRASGEETFDMVVPGMKVHDFHFTEVTKF
ncbi:MAG: TldD/PmbA family protein [Bryobacteraceae bacterium]|nr:TldD/PmbA family protein [Bryobacteraceae bacterium]